MSMMMPAIHEGFARPGYPLNAWYAVAWDAELKRALLSRTVCNRKLVMFRRTDGTAAVLDDACWHRLLPLSMGRLDGDTLTCAYHGLKYDSAGRCSFMPSQETINPSAAVRAYPVVERHRFVWVWPGDPALANPDLVPDLHWNHDPAWAGDGGTIHGKCDWRLIVDNLMDLTHETYVHSSSIGNEAVAEAPFEITHGKTGVTVTRWMIDIEPPPFWRAQLAWINPDANRPDARVDRWQIIHFTPPGAVAIDVGVAPTGTGAPQGDRSQGVSMWVINAMTPETDRTCHYFWANVRDYAITEQRVTTDIRTAITGVFGEDERVVEAQQKAIDDNPDKVFYNLNVDAGAVWARKLIDRMKQAEAAALPVAAE
jgi:vanillate O-demethylase monooxygenase subunit